MKITIRKARNSGVTWLIILMIVGYPLAAILVSFMGVDSRAVTVPYRTFVFGLSMALIGSGFVIPLRGKAVKALFLFLFLYGFRLVYDAYLGGNEYAPDALIFFLLATATPAIAIALCIDEQFIERAFAIRLLLASALCLSGYYVLLWTGRITLEVGIRASLSALNPISLGHAAATAAVAAVYIAVSRRSILYVAIAFAVIGFAIPALLSAGSRGPIAAFAMSLVWLSISDKRRALILVPALTFAAFFVPTDNLAFSRLFGLLHTLDLSSLARLELQRAALADFVAHPFLGKHFMDPAFGAGSWPHNFFLEAAMAMGIVGAVLSLVIVFQCFRAAMIGVNRRNPLLIALLVQALVAAQFSGSIFGGDKLFALFAAVLVLGATHRREVRAHRVSAIRPALLN
ncbi:O-antigen ligase family protein [Sulfitobacter sp. 1A15106]|uniref:O-antigen ligase family protein n=1 Tax=Sulfitobacter sp. 1A15106 TaxID=3368590 RepID=UPI003746B29E